MLNWADLSVLVIILAGPFSGVCAAHDEKAGLVAIILFGLIGLFLGIAVGWVSRRLAYSYLCSKTLHPGAALLLYAIVPMFLLLLVIFVPYFLATAVYE